MFANNLSNLVQLITEEGKIVINREDEVVETMLVAHQGEIVNNAMLEKFDSENQRTDA